MLPLFVAFAIFAADAPAAAEPPVPQGAPSDDYQLVAWCYGNLRGYLELHDQVMPEVTRIETTWRRPGSRLADDLKVYDNMQVQGRAQLKRLEGAMTAAEKASLKPINVVGAQAIRRGRSIWNAGPETTKARMAQEWMSWALPARCETTAAALEKRALLMGPAFQVNAEPQAEPPQTEPPKAEPSQATPPSPAH